MVLFWTISSATSYDKFGMKIAISDDKVGMKITLNFQWMWTEVNLIFFQILITHAKVLMTMACVVNLLMGNPTWDNVLFI